MAKKVMGPGPKKQVSKGPSAGSGNPFAGPSKPRASAYSPAAQKRMAAEAEKFGKYGVPTKTRVLPELAGYGLKVAFAAKKPVIKKKK